jgi:mannosyl-oligosaccharide alpha-1,2-mannosidase
MSPQHHVSVGRKQPLTATQSPAYVLGPVRRARRGLGASLFFIVVIYFLRGAFLQRSQIEYQYAPPPIRPELYPVSKTLPLPRRRPSTIPTIQHAPVVETAQAKEVRERRLAEVRETFLHAWNGYKQEAWAQDELRPVNGGFKTKFCGWAATLVDTLDTLWIMGLYDEFDLALRELEHIDFTGTEGCQINLFETTIRHLGGLLSAFDLSGGKRYILVEKAVELAEVLYTAFDTPNRMPTPHYTWSATNAEANDHRPSPNIVVAVLGSLSLEFTRLSQITGNDKYFDAIQRVMNELDKWQSETALPGMWPAMVDAARINQSIALGSPFPGREELFTLGALADSAYEYLPKVFRSRMCVLCGSVR